MEGIVLAAVLSVAYGSCGMEEISAKNGLVGFVSSPNFPHGYPGNQNCVFNLTADVGFVVHLTFIEFDLEERYSKSGQCLNDYVLVTVVDDEGRDHIGERQCAECDRASLYIIDGYKYELLESSSARKWIDQSTEVRFCGGHAYYNEEGMKSYLSQGNRVIVKFVTKENPSSEQDTKYKEEGLPIGFKLLWTEVNSLVNEAQEPCDGFTCKGGEFCIDDGQNICAERTRLCINKTLQCNGVANCAENDNSDEHNCYSDQIAWTAVGVFTLIFVCTILAMVIHRISMKREIQRRVRERAKFLKKQSNSNYEVPRSNPKRPSDSSIRTVASNTVSRMRRMSPAFFSWSRRTSTAESGAVSLTLQETPLNSNNVWEFPKDASPQPPRVRLQPLEPVNFPRRPAPLASDDDSDETKTAKNRALDEILRYSHTAVV